MKMRITLLPAGQVLSVQVQWMVQVMASLKRDFYIGAMAALADL